MEFNFEFAILILIFLYVVAAVFTFRKTHNTGLASMGFSGLLIVIAYECERAQALADHKREKMTKYLECDHE